MLCFVGRGANAAAMGRHRALKDQAARARAGARAALQVRARPVRPQNPPARVLPPRPAGAGDEAYPGHEAIRHVKHGKEGHVSSECSLEDDCEEVMKHRISRRFGILSKYTLNSPYADGKCFK